MSNTESSNGSGKPILVVGGGIAGMTAAIEAAEAGREVILLEKSPFLGGRVAAFHQYFPKMCPPSCGLEINFKRLRSHPRITVLTLAELAQLKGAPGNYEAIVKLAPRHVTEACTVCGDCSAVCPSEVSDSFNFGLTKTKAIQVRKPVAFPATYVVDRAACPPDCRACAEACKYGAIDLTQSAGTKTFQVASVVIATGWQPYDATRITNLGFGKCANVVTNVVLERMAANDGPTGGKVLRPSDGKAPATVAFVQCAGSRDHNHLPYCSTVCCPASLKQATYIRKLYPEAKIAVYYIDLRTSGSLQELRAKLSTDDKIDLVKGKVGLVEEEPGTGNLRLTVEDVAAGKKKNEIYELVVLATGMVPQTSGLPAGMAFDEFGFLPATDSQGMHSAGCVKRPAAVAASVRDATGAALKALQIAVGATQNG
jgi:quinone-modifying oxidoreductase subunit QmoA